MTELTTLPAAHTVFPPSEQERVQQLAKRWAVLREEHEDLAKEHMANYVDKDRLSRWGPPDLARNPVVKVCRGMSTPGAYGITPTLKGEDAEALKAHADALWALKQDMQFIAYGLGSAWVRIDYAEDLQRVVYETVRPQDIWCEPHPSDPTEPISLYHLDVRLVPDGSGKLVRKYVWQVWSIKGEQPTCTLKVAKPNGELGDDVTLVLSEALRNKIASWPWRYPTGSPLAGQAFLPFERHVSREDGTMFAWQAGRSAFVATMNSAMLATYALKSARDCTGKAHLIAGVRLPAAIAPDASGGGGVRNLQLEAGEITVGEVIEGQTPWHVEIGGGEHLADLQLFNQSYLADVVSDLGLPQQADATRAGSNPVSGVSMYLSQGAKRAEQLRQEPFCRRADLRTLPKVAALVGLSGRVSISYYRIELAPEERRAEREERAERRKAGTLSIVDIYLEENPGVERDAAMVELARIATEEAEVKRAAAAADGAPVAEPASGVVLAEASAVVDQVAAGQISRKSGKGLLQVMFKLSPDEAELILADTGQGFVPTPPETP